MLKIKNILPVLVVVLFLGLSSTAFAQLSCNVASTPVSRDTDTGLTEPAGDLIFNCTGGATATSAATLTIDYGTPITDNTTFPVLTTTPACVPQAGTTCAGSFIRIPALSVVGFPGGAPTVLSVANASGQVVINIPAQPAPAAANSFTVSGVLLGISGSGKTTVQANVSVSPGTNVLITAGQNVATVVTSILPGITAPTAAPGGVGTVLTNGTIITAGFSTRVTENYIDMFRNNSQFNQGATTNSVQLLYTFSGIPAGVTLSSAAGAPCTVSLTDTAGAGTGGTVSIVGNSTLTSTNNTILVQFDNATAEDLTKIERVNLACPTFTIGTTATVPLTPGSITMTVTLAPTGTAFGALGVVLTGLTTPAGLVPRYTSNPLGPLTVINIVPATTNILFPFVAVGNGFDTGFAIANTTTDPYGFAGGGARPQSGTVALFFYPTSGSAFCVTTGGTASLTPGGTACSVLSSTSVGTGLSSGGVVNSGASWVVLGSEVFKQITGAPTAFTGYAFGVTNFTNGHGTNFVADASFSGKFTAGGPALIVPAPAVTNRALGVGAGESLGH
jgi:hypothetical protein